MDLLCNQQNGIYGRTCPKPVKMLSDRVVRLIQKDVSPSWVMIAWREEHRHDCQADKIEQFNQMLCMSVTNSGTSLVEAVLSHNNFPKNPTHRFLINSPLYEAAKSDRDDILHRLLRAGYDPFHPVCESKQLPFIQQLNYFLNYRDILYQRRHLNILEDAVMSNEVGVIAKFQELIRYEASVTDKTCLLYSACHSSPDSLASLLNLAIFSGEDISETDKHNMTPLFIALQSNKCLTHSALVKIWILLEFGAKPQKVFRQDDTILSAICFSLLRHECDKALASDALEVIDHLLDEGVDPAIGHREVFPLLAFTEFNSVYFPQDQYFSVLYKMLRLSSGNIGNRSFTNLVQCMFKTLITGKTNAGDRNTSIKSFIKHFSAKAKFLAELGCSFTYTGKRDKTLHIIIDICYELCDGHPRPRHLECLHGELNLLYEDVDDEVYPRAHDEEICQHHEEIVSYIIELLPVVVQQTRFHHTIITAIMELLAINTDRYGPVWQIYLSFLTHRERNKALLYACSLVVSTGDQSELHPEPDATQKVQLIELLEECRKPSPLKRLACGTLRRALGPKGCLQKVTELGLPLALSRYVLFSD